MSVMCVVCCAQRCALPCRGIWRPEVDLRFSSSISFPLPFFFFQKRSLIDLQSAILARLVGQQVSQVLLSSSHFPTVGLYVHNGKSALVWMLGI